MLLRCALAISLLAQHATAQTPTPSQTRTRSDTPSETESSTRTPSDSATPSPTPSPTASPTETPSRTASSSLTASPTESTSPTPTASATGTPTGSLTPTPTPSPSPSPCAGGKFRSAAPAASAGGGASSAACADCPAGRYNTDGVSCLQCKVGSFTLGLGSTFCFSTSAACPAGSQPAAPGIASLNTDTQCVPLECAPLWRRNNASTACIDVPCAPGQVALAAGTCGACPLNKTCLPLVPAPLPPSTAALALALAANPNCSAASTFPQAPSSSLLSPADASVLVSAPLAIALGVGGAGAALLLLYCLVVRTRARRLQAAFRCSDLLFQVPTAYLGRAGGGAGEVRGRRTALGGLFTALFALTFTGLLLWALLGYVYGNTSETVASGQLLQGLSTQFSALPWAAPRRAPGSAAAALLPLLPPRASLQLRVMSPPGLGCSGFGASPLPPPEQRNFTAKPEAERGEWVPSSASCSANVSLLLLSCIDCELSAASSVSFTLDFACQALYLEAIAVDANGDVNALAFPENGGLLAGAANASSGGLGYLKSVTWALAPTLTTVQDGAGGGRASARGYRLATSASAVALASPALENAGEGVLPLANSVVVSVRLPLQALYFTTSLAPKSSPQQLVSGVVGLLGAIGVFGALFHASKRLRKTALASSVLGAPNSGGGGGGGAGEDGSSRGVGGGAGGAREGSAGSSRQGGSAPDGAQGAQASAAGSALGAQGFAAGSARGAQGAALAAGSSGGGGGGGGSDGAAPTSPASANGSSASSGASSSRGAASRVVSSRGAFPGGPGATAAPLAPAQVRWQVNALQRALGQRAAEPEQLQPKPSARAGRASTELAAAGSAGAAAGAAAAPVTLSAALPAALPAAAPPAALPAAPPADVQRVWVRGEAPVAAAARAAFPSAAGTAAAGDAAALGPAVGTLQSPQRLQQLQGAVDASAQWLQGGALARREAAGAPGGTGAP